MIKTLVSLLFLLASVTLGHAQNRDRRADHAGTFDFYVLSLSWSPTFCAANSRGNDQQCNSDRDYAFIVHGLWPQYEKGYPDFCPTREPERVPRAVGETVFDIMPSMGLIGHQWRKHGSCTGLSQQAYLDTVRRAYETVRVPADLARGATEVTLSADEIEEKFVSTNPALNRRGIAARCEGRRLEEVRICLTRDLRFRDCAEVGRGGCRAASITLPAAR